MVPSRYYDWSSHGVFNWETGEFEGQFQTVTAQGTFLKVSNDLGPVVRPGGGTRKAITEFSSASRRGMLRRLHTIAWDSVPSAMHLVLTFPDYPTIEQAKRCYRMFWKRLERRFGGEDSKLWCLWKLEPQRRSAPHFHLLIGGLPVYGNKKLMAFQRAARLAWADILKTVYYTGTKVAFPFMDYVREGNQMRRYLAKYVTKAHDGAPSLEPVANLAEGGLEGSIEEVESGTSWRRPGRFWGIYGRKHVPWAELVEVCMMRDGWFNEFRRVVRGYLKSKGYRVPWSLYRNPDKGLSLLVENMDDWERVLVALLVKYKGVDEVWEPGEGPE